MTNALRKAPQHTAVGFKQTVSSSPHPHAASPPFPAQGPGEASRTFIFPALHHMALCAWHWSEHTKQTRPAPPVVCVQGVLGG